MSFLDPDCLADYFNSCYQPLHGIWGLAGGGIFGLGLGNSKEKYDWLPAAANDYIFAIVGEELGLIGCAVVLALFALFAVGAFHVIRKTDDPFVRIVSGAHHGLDRRSGAHQHRRRAARLPGARRAAAVHVAGRHVAAVGAHRVRACCCRSRASLPEAEAKRRAAIQQRGRRRSVPRASARARRDGSSGGCATQPVRVGR